MKGEEQFYRHHGFMGAFEALTISSHRLCPWYLTGNTSLRLARLFATDAVFWINLHAKYDLATTYRGMHQRIEAGVSPLVLAA